MAANLIKTLGDGKGPGCTLIIWKLFFPPKVDQRVAKRVFSLIILTSIEMSKLEILSGVQSKLEKIVALYN